MRILIIEDEHFAAKRIQSLILGQLDDAVIVETIDTVEDSIAWLESHIEPSLIFMDIQLADGLSFQIFDRVKINCPVIFTTAYDEYALEAFKVNSIDYLLKPIDEKAFKASMNKYQNFFQSNTSSLDWKHITKDIFSGKEPYKRRFLIKAGNAYTYLNTEDIHLVYSEDGISFALNQQGQRMIIDKTLDNIASCLNPNKFHRVSRKYLVALESIHRIHPYLNSRLKLELKTPTDEEVVVSREKVKEFKSWIDS